VKAPFYNIVMEEEQSEEEDEIHCMEKIKAVLSF